MLSSILSSMTAAVPGRDDYREENPPDANADMGEGEIISEWREGPDKVIERQPGPGEDVSTHHLPCSSLVLADFFLTSILCDALQVEVEVQKNFYVNSPSTTRHPGIAQAHLRDKIRADEARCREYIDHLVHQAKDTMRRGGS
jgi:hypothetical protein